MMLGAPAATGLAVLDMAQAGRFAELRDLFAPQVRPMVTAEALQAAWAAELAQKGPVSSVGAPVSEAAGAGVAVVKIPVTFERGRLPVVVAGHESCRLNGIQLVPS